MLLFLQGGPPQIETFDPKMQAPAETRSSPNVNKRGGRDHWSRLSTLAFGGGLNMVR